MEIKTLYNGEAFDPANTENQLSYKILQGAAEELSYSEEKEENFMNTFICRINAPELETALEGLDFTGKRVRVVSTHEGSGLASMPSDVKKMCKGADVDMNGFAIVGSQAKNSRQKVAEWL